MNQSQVLHVFPYQTNNKRDLLSKKCFLPGNWVVELCSFPPKLSCISARGNNEDITSRYFNFPDYWISIRDWLVQFTKNTGLQDILSIQGYGFWWTLNAQKFVPSLTEIGNLFSWIDLLAAINRDIRPEKIMLHGRHDRIKIVLEQIFSGAEIVITDGSSENQASILWKEQISRPPGLLFVRVILGFLYLVFSWISRPEILFLTSTNLLRPTHENGRLGFHDIYFGDLANLLRKRGWRVLMVEKFGTLGSWPRLVSRSFTFFSDILYLISSLALVKFGFHRKVVGKWQQRWLTIQADLPPHLHYHGVDISEFLYPMIAYEFLHLAPNLEILTEIWRWLLHRWKPKLVIVNDGYGKAAIPIIIAAKLEGIHTIEQQHGVIGRHHFAYLVPRQIGPKTEFPLCDDMLVWGEYFKRLLINSGVFQNSRVIVCGFPRIDRLVNTFAQNLSPKSFLGLDPDMPVVLYTSNGFALDWIDDFLDGVQMSSQSRNIHWLIKLHPRENIQSLWLEKIRYRKIENIQVLDGNQEFYSLLMACDIHVSFASTTLIEAAVIGKPNLGFNVSGISDPGQFMQSKAFYPVRPHEIGAVISKILDDPVFLDSILLDQKVFATEWCLHDGQALERIASFVEKIIENCSNEED